MNSTLPFQLPSTPSRQKCGTPGSIFRTPSRPRSSTSRASSASRTPGSAHLTPGNRYIPSRLDGDLEFSRFQVATPAKGKTCKKNGNSTSPAKNCNSGGGKVEQTRQDMMDQLLALKGQKKNDRVLSLQTTPQRRNADKYEYWQSYCNSNTPILSSKKPRKTPKSADKVLDAPNLINDYYLNVLDWSSQDLLGVALGGAVYIFDVPRGDIQQLCDVEEEEPLYVTSLRWDPVGKHLAVATNNAEIKLWDVGAGKCVRTMKSHQNRVSSLCWHPKASLLSTGARSGHIHNYDPRSHRYHVHSVRAHKLDVCGLEWSASGRFLASGGNDNAVNIWDYYSHDPWSKPYQSFTKHTAAVKALSWCPWQSSVLASGGGTADKSIRLWNVCSGESVGHAPTDSQVSGLVWSASHRELLSCHGNPSNSLRLWKWQPSNTSNTKNSSSSNDSDVAMGLTQVGEMCGHEGRILHMSSSPDGQSVVTAAADETLRFWRCFEGSKNLTSHRGSPLSEITISNYIR